MSSSEFDSHADKRITEWLKQLRYFSFRRAYSPYHQDNDEFLVAFSYTDATDLYNKLYQLGIHVKLAHDFMPISEIKSFNDIQQPGNQFLKGHIVNIWIYDGYFTISVFGTMATPFDVSVGDFEACLQLEKHFDNLGWQNLVNKQTG